MASELAGIPNAKIRFISAGRILSEEIEEFTNAETDTTSYSGFARASRPEGVSSVDSAYEVLVASGLKMDKTKFDAFAVDTIRSLEQQSQKVSREITLMEPSFYGNIPATASRTLILASMGATMEDKLTTILNSARDAGEEVTSVLDAAQGVIDAILSPIDVLDGFKSIVQSLTSQAKKLQKAINLMIPMILKIGKNCPR